MRLGDEETAGTSTSYLPNGLCEVEDANGEANGLADAAEGPGDGPNGLVAGEVDAENGDGDDDDAATAQQKQISGLICRFATPLPPSTNFRTPIPNLWDTETVMMSITTISSEDSSASRKGRVGFLRTCCELEGYNNACKR